MVHPDVPYRKLPEELLAMILPLASAKDQTSLCRTSKRFKRIVLPILYHHIFISNVENLTRLYETLEMHGDSAVKPGDYAEQLSVVITRDDGYVQCVLFMNYGEDC